MPNPHAKPPPGSLWVKGQPSPNPGGRPKGAIVGMAREIREATQDGRKLIDLCLRILDGEERGAKTRDKIECARLLWDRGWGKAVETVILGQMDEGSRNELLGLSPEQLLALVRVVQNKGELPPAASAPIVDGQVLAPVQTTTAAIVPSDDPSEDK